MTVRLPNSVYLHVPRCGGEWFRRVCDVCKLTRQVERDYPWRQLPKPWDTLKAFAFIRHPLAWVGSRWAAFMNKTADGGLGLNHLFEDCVGATFAGTLRRLTAERPGLVGATYSEITHGPVRLARLEDLPGAAVRLLTEFEPGCDLRPAAAVIPMNGCSGLPQYKAEIASVDGGLIEDFLRGEAHAMEMWEEANG